MAASRHLIFHFDTLVTCCLQAWGMLEARAGNLARARELFQQGVWAQPASRNVSRVWQVRPRAPFTAMLCAQRAHATWSWPRSRGIQGFESAAGCGAWLLQRHASLLTIGERMLCL